jgi:hypothetical protein
MICVKEKEQRWEYNKFYYPAFLLSTVNVYFNKKEFLFFD